MKRIFILICLCIPIYAAGQIEKPISKGNSIISGGGTIQFSKWKNGGETRSITFNPGFGYFVIDNLALGVNTSFGFYKSGYRSYSYGIGPYAKYYFNNGLFLKTETFFTYNKALPHTGTIKSTNLSVAPGLGYAIFLNPKISLEPSITYRYTHSKIDSDLTIKNNDIFFELKFNIFL